jgi:hypothetical protein
VIEPIRRFYNHEISLPQLINELDINNTVFEIQMKDDTESKHYIICDKDRYAGYDEDYKIYLLSTDLKRTEKFYVSDLQDVLLNQDRYKIKAKVCYRFDLIG